MLSEKEKNWKLYLYLLLAMVLAVVLLFAAIHAGGNTKKNTGIIYEPGTVTVPGLGAVWNYIPLNGEWEYYPDILLCSNSTDSLPEPFYVSLPVSWVDLPQEIRPSDRKGSFRIRLKQVPDFGLSSLCIDMGHVSADYTIFVNGTDISSYALAGPEAYPYHIIDDYDDIEIVLEVSDGLDGLQTIPVFGPVFQVMKNYDIQRNFLLITFIAFLAVFLTFFIFCLVGGAKGISVYFGVGAFLTLLYFISHYWVSGYVDVLSSLISLKYMEPLFYISSSVVVYIFFLFIYVECSQIIKPRSIFLGTGLFACAEIAYVLHIATPAYLWLYLFYAIFFMQIASLFWNTVRIVVHRAPRAFPMSSVLLSLSAALVAVMISFNSGWFYLPVYFYPLALAFFLCFSFYRYSFFYRAQILRMQKLLDLEKQNSKMKTALFASQIQPHFLYNSLSSIQALCSIDSEKAEELIIHFSDYLRHNIDFMNYSELVEFHSELEHIQNYIYIQKARFGEKLNYTESIETEEFLIPPLSIQPLIENAVKYGIRGTNQGGHVSLRVEIQSQSICITVNNTPGPYFDVAQTPLRSLENIQHRLQVLCDASFDIHSFIDGSGTTIEIHIPIRERRNHQDEYRNR